MDVALPPRARSGRRGAHRGLADLGNTMPAANAADAAAPKKASRQTGDRVAGRPDGRAGAAALGGSRPRVGKPGPILGPGMRYRILGHDRQRRRDGGHARQRRHAHRLRERGRPALHRAQDPHRRAPAREGADRPPPLPSWRRRPSACSAGRFASRRVGERGVQRGAPSHRARDERGGCGGDGQDYTLGLPAWPAAPGATSTDVPHERGPHRPTTAGARQAAVPSHGRRPQGERPADRVCPSPSRTSTKPSFGSRRISGGRAPPQRDVEPDERRQPRSRPRTSSGRARSRRAGR
jgi:hypothetical protein